LTDYLHRHSEIDAMCSKNGTVRFLTTEADDKFAAMAGVFLGENIHAERIVIPA
jgi:glutamate racemase